jgi:hypothetical protein
LRQSPTRLVLFWHSSSPRRKNKMISCPASLQVSCSNGEMHHVEMYDPEVGPEDGHANITLYHNLAQVSTKKLISFFVFSGLTSLFGMRTLFGYQSLRSAQIFLELAAYLTKTWISSQLQDLPAICLNGALDDLAGTPCISLQWAQ